MKIFHYFVCFSVLHIPAGVYGYDLQSEGNWNENIKNLNKTEMWIFDKWNHFLGITGKRRECNRTVSRKVLHLEIGPGSLRAPN